MHCVGVRLAALTVLAAAAPTAAAECSLAKFAELPVTMADHKPLVEGSINGVTALFIADSGAFFSMISTESAKRFQLKQTYLPAGYMVQGIGGSEVPQLGTAKEFALKGLHGPAIKNVEFLVAGNKFAGNAAGIIGQNVLAYGDAEYDLANGVIRLFKPKGCDKQVLAYWHGSKDVGTIDVAQTTRLEPHILGWATLNDVKIRVLFDTGAPTSFLTKRAASRAGVKPEEDGVVAGEGSFGIGKRSVETWIAPFKTLDLGGEQIRNIKLRVGDFDAVLGADMLLGADFFLSHRIYIANSQHRLFFTYNGGPVFDLGVHNKEASASQPAETKSDALPATDPAGDLPTDAAGFTRRGAAFISRRDYVSAIADFDHAIELDRMYAEAYYQRAFARWWNKQPVLAMADLDQALALRSDMVAALMLRGELRLANKDESGARSDFETVARVAPSDTSSALRISQAYERQGLYQEAIIHLDRWISVNPKDDRMPSALNSRCWARASLGKELDLALQDCDNALRRGPRTSQVLDSRGLVKLRNGDVDGAISDYKAALALQPKSASSMYGLGLAEARKGTIVDGQVHMQAAAAIRSSIADEFKRMGLIP